MSHPSFFIKTFGCQMNERDSEIMAQTLAEKGYVESMDMENSDLVILNTCSIRAKAEQKVMSLLGMLRRARKRRPSMRICVAGCVAEQEGAHLIERMPHVDLVLGTQNIYQLTDLLAGLDQAGKVATGLSPDYEIPAYIPVFPASSTSPEPLFRKFLTIMQGCNNFCSYCVVPHTRGREISRKVKDIVAEAEALVQAGIKEITLLGQNVNSYGMTNQVTEDGSPFPFSLLLREIAQLSGLKRLRFTTSNPKDLSDDLMRCFSEIDILCHHFHLPVQSGSNLVLKQMNRKYTRELYFERVASLRSYCPEIALSTDIIVGFPGETDQDFEQTMDLLETVRFQGSFSFKYSDRPGTRSADFADKVDEDIKSRRLQRFQARQDEISLEYNQKFIDRQVEIMVEKISPEGLIGRTGSNHIVHINNPALPHCSPGDLVRVMINHGGPHSLRGELAGPAQEKRQ